MRPRRKPNFRWLAIQGAHLVDAKKGEDILLLDVSKSSDLTNFFLVVTATSSAHQHALTETIAREFAKQGVVPIHREGRWGTSWSVVDYGGIIVHVMDRPTREFYSLERVWHSNGRKVHWNRKAKRNVHA